jgi:hypothetical protein
MLINQVFSFCNFQKQCKKLLYQMEFIEFNSDSDIFLTFYVLFNHIWGQLQIFSDLVL